MQHSLAEIPPLLRADSSTALTISTNRRLVESAGLEIVSAVEETADEDGQPTTFLWVIARKPEDVKRET